MTCIFIWVLQVVDMRWGVRDESSDDHTTLELCLKELRGCQQLSTGPNFVVSPGLVSFTFSSSIATVLILN